MNSTSDGCLVTMDHVYQALDIRLGYDAHKETDIAALLDPPPLPIKGHPKVLYLHPCVWGSSVGSLSRHSFSRYTLPTDGYLQKWAKGAGRGSVWDDIIEHADCPLEWSSTSIGPSDAGGVEVATFLTAYLDAEIPRAEELVEFAETEGARLGVAAPTPEAYPMPDSDILAMFGKHEYDVRREKHQTAELWAGAEHQLASLRRWRAAAGEPKHKSVKEFCTWLEQRVRACGRARQVSFPHATRNHSCTVV